MSSKKKDPHASGKANAGSNSKTRRRYNKKRSENQDITAQITIKSSAVSAAKIYIDHGFSPIPIPPSSKCPQLKDWPNIRLKAKEVCDNFEADSNLGIVLGDASHGLIDIDLDDPIATQIYSYFLPHTLAFGHGLLQPTHLLYLTTSKEYKNKKFSDPDGTTLLELRGNKQQTIFPPSVHPNGEPIEWTPGSALSAGSENRPF